MQNENDNSESHSPAEPFDTISLFYELERRKLSAVSRLTDEEIVSELKRRGQWKPT